MTRGSEEKKEKGAECPFSINWKNGWTRIDDNTRHAIEAYSTEYLRYLDVAKTEREAVRESERQARAAGFVDIGALSAWTPGAKVLLNHRGKALVLAVLGTESPLAGVNLVASHVDAPRIDLKMRPLREDEEFALFETNYYGGIKKFQWLQTPLALHGVVSTSSGKMVEICVGEDATDPVFFIPDILPHLGAKVQKGKTVQEAFPGEELDVVVGSAPLANEEKQAVKRNILTILNAKYGIVESDFVSAEIEMVPAGKARRVGFDEALIGGYGQDDRVCAFASLKALFDLKGTPKRTAVVVLADKEEIGSVGTSGLTSAYMDRFVDELLALAKPQFNPLDVRRAWDATRALSADVNVGVDPIFKSVHEMGNAARLGYGPVLTKYTGSGGKGGANDASAEFMGDMRRLFDHSSLIWQTGVLGRVEEGGGGTVAGDIAARGADVVDFGVAVVGMHSLFEVTSKLDCYYCYQGIKAFLV